MIKVYFETTGYAELVAIFGDELTYQACLPALKRTAKICGFCKVTETVKEEVEICKL